MTQTYLKHSSTPIFSPVLFFFYMRVNPENDDVNMYGMLERGPLWHTNSLMSLTISNTAFGCASLSAFSDILFSSSDLVLNHSATSLAVSFELRVKTPAPLSTTYGTFPFSCDFNRKGVLYEPFQIINVNNFDNLSFYDLSRNHRII